MELLCKEKLIEILELEGIQDQDVLAAIKKIPRELFVLDEYQNEAYANIALPINFGQTISQPYVVAKMTEALHASGSMDKVLEIGTGSGYQTAILAELAKEVYSVERIYSLHEVAKEHLEKLNIKNVKLHYGDGYLGWQEYAPYDAIIVTAAVKAIPDNLIAQLKIGGRMVVPVGNYFGQQLILITKKELGVSEEKLDPVVFVPLLSGVE